MKQFEYDPEQYNIKRERGRAKKLKSSQWWKRRMAKGVCHYCSRSVSPGQLTMDHIVPISRGGVSSRGNVVPCCHECNNKKKESLPMEWAEYLKSKF